MTTLPLPGWSSIPQFRQASEDCDLTPFYSITAENISKSRKSNSRKNPTYENFGYLNQAISISQRYVSIYCGSLVFHSSTEVENDQ